MKKPRRTRNPPLVLKRPLKRTLLGVKRSTQRNKIDSLKNGGQPSCKTRRGGAFARTTRRRNAEGRAGTTIQSGDRYDLDANMVVKCTHALVGTGAVAQAGVWILTAIVWAAVFNAKFILFSVHPVRVQTLTCRNKAHNYSAPEFRRHTSHNPRHTRSATDPHYQTERDGYKRTRYLEWDRRSRLDRRAYRYRI